MACGVLGLALALAGCGGGGSAAQAAAPAPSTPASDASRSGTLLTEAAAFYPRLLRLSHQADAAANGRILASVTSFPDGRGEASVFASDDDGRSFRKIGAVRDDGWAPGLCCGSIFELPQAVGALPAGTLLWSASVGQETADQPMQLPVYKSLDAGRSWSLLSRCGLGRGPRGSLGGVWEPEFALAPDGSLLCFYSDETQPTPDQNLMLVRSRDGLTWSEPQPLFTTQPHNARPGMAVVQRLGPGAGSRRYAMGYEVCGMFVASLPGNDCKVYLKTSVDGLDWSPTQAEGQLVRTDDGRYLRAAPTLAWVPVRDRLLLSAQFVHHSDGRHDAAASGATLLLSSTADGSGPWKAFAAPLAARQMATDANWCQHYSSALLPSLDGRSVLMMASDFDTSDPRRPCRTWFARGTLPVD
ncbi:sialidase family protein [Aquabacterium sp. OR-4]|uniref:sialidase family protein n=1 Tax=Aquabacterium sp. OR-4 TaxID=2978127 RepID=UPI0021B324C2|nr:sialidase family protein [Aquabacterium sp. OR-4]MDT7838014.1 sialidase family protein [Aquabacterium sp. OR-4]